MTCDEAVNLISARTDGEISPEQDAALEGHLATCSACRELAEAMSAQDAALDNLFADRRDGAVAVAERVIRRLETKGNATAAKNVSSSGLGIGGWMRTGLAAAAGFALAVVV